MNKTQQRIYDYIKFLSYGCKLLNPPIGIPVILTKKNIADKLNLNPMTVKRNLEYLIENKHIYIYKINTSYIYSLSEIDITKDMFIRLRV